MAEIKIEQKKQIWPWLLVGLLIAGLLVYFLANRNDDKNQEAIAITKTNESDLINVQENNSTVAAYVSFIENAEDEMSLDHTYTNEALLRLIDATNAMANEVGYEVRADLDKVKEYAEMITDNPLETTHADYIRKASDILTNVLQNIQRANYPGLTSEVAELRKASESIKSEVLTLDQQDEVKTFFSKAANLLKKMN